MIKTEFGIIDHFDSNGDYIIDEAIQLVYIDDDLYINDWWNKLLAMKTFFQDLNKPAQALDRWGITIIPPESLPIFQNIVLTDRRIKTDSHLIELVNLIDYAIRNKKYMVHYGV